MREPQNTGRREFMKSVALAAGATSPGQGGDTAREASPQATPTAGGGPEPAYPRVFTGAALEMMCFPLGGIGAGSIGLGGRGQLRDWEIFNRADKGNSPAYAFPSIWVQESGKAPVAHVLESRIEPPYEGQDGLGSRNAPGLSRLERAVFTGEFPRARIEFHDRTLPVEVSLEAGTPFIPLDADESGLPVAVLRYRVKNTGKAAASVSIAFSIENPVHSLEAAARQAVPADTRVNEARREDGLVGLLMHNPGLEKSDPGSGSFALVVLPEGDGEVTLLRGWPAGRWWNSPLLFWDDFTDIGIGEERPRVRQFRPRGPARRRWRGDAAARLAGRPLVEQPTALLGRLHRRRFAGPGGSPDRPGGVRVFPAQAGPRRRGPVCVSAGLAFPQPHAGALRLARAQGVREDHHRQLVRHPVSGRMDGGAIRGPQPGAPGGTHRPLCGRHPRNHPSRRGQGSGHVQSLDSGQHHVLPYRGRRVPRLRGSERSHRLLLRQLHARLELRDRDGAPVSRAFPFPAPQRLRIFHGRAGRHAFPAGAARRRGALRFCRRRRADGPDHQGLSGLAAFRGRGFSAAVLAQGQAGARIRLGARRLGCRPRRRARRRPA